MVGNGGKRETKRRKQSNETQTDSHSNAIRMEIETFLVSFVIISKQLNRI